MPQPGDMHWWCCGLQMQLYPALHRYENIIEMPDTFLFWPVVQAFPYWGEIFHSLRTLHCWQRGKTCVGWNSCWVKFSSKTSSGFKDTKPLTHSAPLWYRSIPDKRAEKYFHVILLITWQRQNNGKAEGKFSWHCWIIFLEKSTGLWIIKGFCLCQGGNGVLDTFPVCLLPVSQNSKWLHNGRKLEPASCTCRVLWKQIGKCLHRLLILTEPG